MSLQYSVQVVGLEIDGHEIINLFSSLTIASEAFDSYRKSYPNHTICMYQTTKKLIKEDIGVPNLPRIIAQCPNGHKGVDYRKVPIVTLGNNGKYLCRTCGWKET